MSEITANRSEFASLPLHPDLLKAVVDLGYTSPTPIQVQAIPAILDRKDVLGLAQTGTGKTAAFGLPMLHHLLKDSRGKGKPRVLILAPTRELAAQIDGEMSKLGKHTRLNSVLIFGGVAAGPQIGKLRRQPEIIVACPGRLLDLAQQREVSLDAIEILVLDEADQMFDMGFLPTLKRIIKMLPERRQNLLFSATMPDEIRVFANQILRQPVVVEVEHKKPLESVRHRMIRVHEADKKTALQQLLRKEQVDSAIIFTRTKHKARNLARLLEGAGHKAVALQGNMSQPQRDRAMNGFRGGEFDILVATDIAGRGIDVSDITHVINFDIPATAEAYTHRTGRTGRAGKGGLAITLVAPEDTKQLRQIERGSSVKIQFEEFAGGSGSSVGRRTEAEPPAASQHIRPRSDFGRLRSPSADNRHRPRSTGAGKPGDSSRASTGGRGAASSNANKSATKGTGEHPVQPSRNRSGRGSGRPEDRSGGSTTGRGGTRGGNWGR